MYGTENFHQEIRYRTSIELFLNLDEFLKINAPNLHLIDIISHNGLNLSSSREILFEEIKDSFRDESWSGPWHIFGASQALQINIIPIHPSMDKRIKDYLNTEIKSLNSHGTVNISWTHTTNKNVDNCVWSPNHFVCVLPVFKDYFENAVQKRKENDILEHSNSSIEIIKKNLYDESEYINKQISSGDLSYYQEFNSIKITSEDELDITDAEIKNEEDKAYCSSSNQKQKSFQSKNDLDVIKIDSDNEENNGSVEKEAQSLGDFVRHIDFGYNRLECVLFTEQQYNDLIRFCTSYRNFSIVNIDTTFNLGHYYVTYLTYRNISLKVQATETHPIYNSFAKIKWSLNSLVNDYYTTNDIEGTNHKLKEMAQHSKKILSNIFDLFETLAKSQTDLSFLAMKGSGEYKVSNYFGSYSYSSQRWSQFCPEEQEKKIKSFLRFEQKKSETEPNITEIYRRKPLDKKSKNEK
ncbi:unnamed protein product [Brachionus calyciflorus]|uniref:Uncharacterized protein n=1 Tax=Brachionus calyciflorus TaxID=104777 RepID=A0A814D076_9BILA|nr:unnamed protein product [Brachionus calyciflorus]